MNSTIHFCILLPCARGEKNVIMGLPLCLVCMLAKYLMNNLTYFKKTECTQLDDIDLGSQLNSRWLPQSADLSLRSCIVCKQLYLFPNK